MLKLLSMELIHYERQQRDSDIAPLSSKELLDIQATIECRSL